ncbi:MAG: hypothetical protein KKD33_01595 [Verrucomicrobia bacterium]|nr:hypothetical protein [Verrucomicrobiota bacterium]MBU4285619.1 hypothetical protein [Verrucomicrobiota bacterium]
MKKHEKKQTQPTERTNAAGTLLITDLRCALPSEAWTDAGATVNNSEPSRQSSGKWQALHYRSALYEGYMLRTVYPDATPLRIPLGRSGWHAVSIGLAHAAGGETFVETRLTGDTKWRLLGDYYYRPPFDRARLCEEPWILADLTGQDLEIRCPADGWGGSAGGHCSIYAVRAVPLRAEDVPAAASRHHRRFVLFSNTSSPFYSDRFANEEWDALCYNNGEADCLCYPTTVGTPIMLGAWAVAGHLKQLFDSIRAPLARGEDCLRQCIDQVHGIGKRFWMGFRPQSWVHCMPSLDQILRSRFFSAHPECRCIEADGAALSTLSVAFPAVRAHINALLGETLARGADGVTLLFSRGFALVRYEDPVRERFRALYGVEARKVPDSDPRLHRVWAEFMTAWLRELRALLDAKGPAPLAKRRELTVMTGPCLEWNLAYGIDVEAWAREGLVDVVIPYPRHDHTDRIGATIIDRTDGWIDIEAYGRALKGTAAELIPSLGHFMHLESLTVLRQRAHEYYQAGATGLCRWDNDDCMAGARLDDPEIQRVWRACRPPQDNPLLEIGGLRVDAFSPGTGFD